MPAKFDSLQSDLSLMILCSSTLGGEAARRLLEETEQGVEEIAAACGFSVQNSCAALFCDRSRPRRANTANVSDRREILQSSCQFRSKLITGHFVNRDLLQIGAMPFAQYLA